MPADDASDRAGVPAKGPAGRTSRPAKSGAKRAAPRAASATAAKTTKVRPNPGTSDAADRSWLVEDESPTVPTAPTPWFEAPGDDSPALRAAMSQPTIGSPVTDLAVRPVDDDRTGSIGRVSRPDTGTSVVGTTDRPTGRSPRVAGAEPAPAGPNTQQMPVQPGAAQPVPAVAPAPPTPRRSATRQRPRVRRVVRVVRRVDAWSVFKVAAIFWLTAYFVLLVAGVLLWSVVNSTGTLDNLENFIAKTFALDSFAFNGGEIFRASWLLGLVLVVAGTAATVTMAVFFNLISDLTGGVRVTVLEEEIRRTD